MKRLFPSFPESLPAMEEEVLLRWQKDDIFQQSLRKTADGESFNFYEGPPTANGLPGIHHMLSRSIKDSVARFKTMRGYFVPRIAGWDTHGLPVEIEAEKTLGLSGKKDIEKIGIEKFNAVCKSSVLKYTSDWERFSARIGYWLDYTTPYVTYNADYIESVWWLLKKIYDRELMYRSYKILHYCPRCGTGLANHEVSQGYKDVSDPSLYFSVPVSGGEFSGTELVVWTTTPWTLPANTAMAVNPSILYAEVEANGKRYLLAESQVGIVFENAVKLRTVTGTALAGLRYNRPFSWEAPSSQLDSAPGDCDTDKDKLWTIVAADFVNEKSGTGVVHLAPAFGEEDFEVAKELRLPVLVHLDEAGKFLDNVPVAAGRFFKDADKDVIVALKKEGRVIISRKEVHSYPHCWRCSSPLLFMARSSWYIRTSLVRDVMTQQNSTVRWFPEEVGSGRFGEWLSKNVDWAISRNRYWGTPLPVWVCDTDPAHVQFIGSFAELREATGMELPGVDPHRPFVDTLTWACPHCPGEMRRTPEVIDVWFDSGAMPFAQLHYPFENQEVFDKRFPADFICEGVDQTRGWFYSLLAVAVLAGKDAPYRHVVVNDLVLDENGKKMSKSLKNVVDPWEVIPEFGADSIRWYLLSSSQPWLPKKFSTRGIKEVKSNVFDTLRHTYSFLEMYANIEKWQPTSSVAPKPEDLLAMWILSRVATLIEEVSSHMDGYDLTSAVRAITLFVDDLSNWYVRRSRVKFWGKVENKETTEAFETLHYCLSELAKVMAPFSPFFADWLYQALGNGTSVHLEAYPHASRELLNPTLEQEMKDARLVAALGLALRNDTKIKVKQPLESLYVVMPSRRTLRSSLLGVVAGEVNVKEVRLVEKESDVVSFTVLVKPDYKVLGRKYGKKTSIIGEALQKIDGETACRLEGGEKITLLVDGFAYESASEDFTLVKEARGSYRLRAQEGCTVLLDTEITPALREQGIIRELISVVQNLRKAKGLSIENRISLYLAGDECFHTVVTAHEEVLSSETLAVEIIWTESIPLELEAVEFVTKEARGKVALVIQAE